MDSPVIFGQIQTSPYSSEVGQYFLEPIQAHKDDFTESSEIHVVCLQAVLSRCINRVPHQQLHMNI
jgi:hypothetical protein